MCVILTSAGSITPPPRIAREVISMQNCGKRIARENNTLSWEELSEVVLDVEVTLNDQPLSYMEDDVELPVVTPNAMLNNKPSILPELIPHHIDN